MGLLVGPWVLVPAPAPASYPPAGTMQGPSLLTPGFELGPSLHSMGNGHRHPGRYPPSCPWGTGQLVIPLSSLSRFVHQSVGQRYGLGVGGKSGLKLKVTELIPFLPLVNCQQ